MGGEGEGAGAAPPPPPPSVSWAQNSAVVFLTFNVECEKPQIDISTSAVKFRGVCAPNGELRAVCIPLFAAVSQEDSTIENKGRFIEVVLAKERADEPWWPALTSDRVKHHWLKVDFERWRDENESDNEDYKTIVPDMFSDLGPANDDDADDDSSIEEEDLPDLE